MNTSKAASEMGKAMHRKLKEKLGEKGYSDMQRERAKKRRGKGNKKIIHEM